MSWSRLAPIRRIGIFVVVGGLSSGPSPAWAVRAAAPEILFERAGSLGAPDPQYSDGSFYDEYSVPVTAGERLRITLTSTDFDPYLIVSAPGDKRQVNDDVSENDRNCRIELTSSASGSLDIRASSFTGNVTGNYRLTVERWNGAPAPVEPPAPADPRPAMTILWGGRDDTAGGIPAALSALCISPRGNPVLAAGGDLFDLGGRRFLTRSGAVGHCAYAPSGALLVVSGRSLGYYAGGAVRSEVELPESGMKLAAGRGGIYVFGGDGRRATGLYFIDPARGHVKLLDMPVPIGAAAVVGDTLFFSAANDIYRLVPGGEMQILCRLPGPAVTSIAAAADGTVFFTAGRTLYSWRGGEVSLIAENIGEIVTWHSTGLYVLDARNRCLVRFDGISGRNV